jgi:5-formyltetrahydrofolate cyclo-ligase
MPDGERELAAAAIASRCESILAGLVPDDIVAVYAAKGSEVDPRSIDVRARQLGLRVVYPRVVPGQPWLDFHFVEPQALRVASFGLREPSPQEPRAKLSEIDVFFVPGIGFDPLGGRLGWGKGYYDHTFAQAPQAMRFGVAFECQVIDRVPMVDHDILLHGLFTEAEIRRFGV